MAKLPKVNGLFFFSDFCFKKIKRPTGISDFSCLFLLSQFVRGIFTLLAIGLSVVGAKL